MSPARSATLRVLLLSPVASGGESNGDMQYTEDLLAHPPDGVEYVSMVDALAGGELVAQPAWRGPGGRPANLSQAAWASARLGLNGLRRLGWMLPDGVHWWRVDAPFDAVHVHCLPVHLTGRVPPMLVTDSAGTFWYWTAAKGMEEPRAWRMLDRERRVARRPRLHPSVGQHRACRRRTGLRRGGPRSSRPDRARPVACRRRSAGRPPRRPRATGPCRSHPALRGPQLRDQGRRRRAADLCRRAQPVALGPLDRGRARPSRPGHPRGGLARAPRSGRAL